MDLDFLPFEINQIYNVNCMDLLNSLPDNCIPAIITDFPYGIDFQSNQRVKSEKFKKIANDKKPYIEWIEEAYRVTEEDGGRLICFYRYDVQDVLFDELELCGFTIKSQLVWDKKVHGMGDLKGEFSPAHELMVYATKGRYEFSGEVKRPTTVYNCQRVDAMKLCHPNEKPVILNQALIRDITTKNELVLDLFSGSGSLSVAAKIEGRNWLACDLDKRYVDIGNQRCSQVERRVF